jgi:hypothetical protein
MQKPGITAKNNIIGHNANKEKNGQMGQLDNGK